MSRKLDAAVVEGLGGEEVMYQTYATTSNTEDGTDATETHIEVEAGKVTFKRFKNKCPICGGKRYLKVIKRKITLFGWCVGKVVEIPCDYCDRFLKPLKREWSE